jgi:hypothetical protein
MIRSHISGVMASGDSAKLSTPEVYLCLNARLSISRRTSSGLPRKTTGGGILGVRSGFIELVR